MKRSEINPLPSYFDQYILKVEDIELMDALKKYGIGYFQAEYKSLKNLRDMTYATGKWTVKDILQHVVDSERIFAYRALRISRKDSTPLPGYDQELLASNAGASRRTVGELLREFELVRESNIMMFENFAPDMLANVGNCNNIRMSALAVGFTIVGHAIHHMNVIRERYYPLLNQL